jgi:hypothetical protein
MLDFSAILNNFIIFFFLDYLDIWCDGFVCKVTPYELKVG